MYATIEAEIENGVVIGLEKDKLPARAHVLITLIDTPSVQSKLKPDWDVIQQQIGKLQLRQDTVQWQRSLRSEWR